MTDRDNAHDPLERAWALIDPRTQRGLGDVGLPGHQLVESIDADGNRELWIADCGVVGRRDVDHGDPCPKHDLDEPLPDETRARVWSVPIRCGAPTECGRPCRRRVAQSGQRCGAHREVLR
ncbi:hypothetical protein [Gordonia jacobaea]|uniref:hypothetical protein n=1 Tax=Gordonia jacobaea TaxID=122202 RepID=UPI003D7649C3